MEAPSDGSCRIGSPNGPLSYHERAVLNLSFGGHIYETANIDWEPLFEDVVELRELLPGRRLVADAVVKKILIPKRDARALPGMIDLSHYYNCLLDEAWP